MASYICGLNPSGNAARDGRMKEGDQILEVNGMIVYNRHHLNASALIQGLPDADMTFVLLRGKSEAANEAMAVKPLTQFPAEPFKDNPIERYRKYKGLREITVNKGNEGWGIKIIEGKHSVAGSGVFISNMQPGSCAEKAGLLVGDMILAVNGEDYVGISYPVAADSLKAASGVVKLIVANPNLSAEQQQQSQQQQEKHTMQQKKKEQAPQPPPPPPPTAEQPLPAEAKEKEEPPTASAAASKPKVAPKPAIAPKPSGLSPTHKPNVEAVKSNPVIPSPKTVPAPQPPTSAPPKVTQGSKAVPTRKPVASPRRKEMDPATNPATCEISPGNDTTIEITKDKDEAGKPMGLGLSIVGGSDTLLGAIFIHEVYEKGAAHKDGRLRPGDQILEVMHDDLRNVTHARALHSLRQTPNRVRLVIHREDDEIYETLEVELHKKKDRGLGLSIGQ